MSPDPRCNTRRLLLGALSPLMMLIAACGSSSAASPTPSPSAQASRATNKQVLTKGKVLAVSSSSITVLNKAITQTFPLAASVTVKQSGKKVSLSAVQQGETVVLYAANNTTGGPMVARIVIKGAAPSSTTTTTT